MATLNPSPGALRTFSTGNRGVLEVHLCCVGALDTHLLLRWSVGHPSKSSLNNKRRNLLSNCASFLILDRSLAKHGKDLGYSTVGDPNFPAIQNPVSPSLIELGSSFDGASI